ncbi:hypothetical protein Nmel_015389 [Mimus melanotis]
MPPRCHLPFLSPAGSMALGWAVLVLLVLSPLQACGAELLQPGLPGGGQWVWGVAKPLLLSRGKRDDSGQEPSTKASLLRVPTTADPMDDSPEPELLLSSAAPAPSTNASLPQVLAVSTTAEPMNETDSPKPDLLEDSVAPAAPSASASTSLPWVPAVSTTADPMDETDPPDPDLLPTSEPGTSSAPEKTIAITTPSWVAEGTVTDGLDSSSSTGPPSAARPAFVTTTGYRKRKKSGAPPAPTLPALWDTTPSGTAVPWEPDGVMSKCLLAILLLGLVAATFLVCTGVLGTLLWRRARTGQRRFSRTEMVCISSLLSDAEAAAGPRPVPARRHKLLLPDGSSEPDGDNLTLSSFLPEHS